MLRNILREIRIHPSACLPCTWMTDPTGKWESGSSTPPGRINPLVRSGGSRQNCLDLASSGGPPAEARSPEL
jgi:hypothetical protein